MSGHSKWATIKHKKGKADAQRGKIFTKLIKEITIAARMGGGDPETNPRLRQAILTARGQNMPAENIERAIKKGTGDLEGVIYEEVAYEGYGPGGAAIIVECQTDNKNRCVSEVRRIFTKAGGNMANQNAVAWMFDSKGLIEVDHTGVEEDTLMEAAIDAGADDVQDMESVFEVTTAPTDLMAVADILKNAGFNVTSAKLAKIPQNMLKLTGKEAEQMMRLMDALEDADDTQNVWSNFDIDESEMESLMG
jgi:YebC/PmpR family DNA-binding regulatory protein